MKTIRECLERLVLLKAVEADSWEAWREAYADANEALAVRTDAAAHDKAGVPADPLCPQCGQPMEFYAAHCYSRKNTWYWKHCDSFAEIER